MESGAKQSRELQFAAAIALIGTIALCALILEEAEQLPLRSGRNSPTVFWRVWPTTFPPDIAAAQTAEVRRRIAEVESGEVTLIPGDEALAHVRRIVASARTAN